MNPFLLCHLKIMITFIVNEGQNKVSESQHKFFRFEEGKTNVIESNKFAIEGSQFPLSFLCQCYPWTETDH